MHSSQKGNQWYFGMKANIGVDADSGLVHAVRCTSGQVNDVTQAHQLTSRHRKKLVAMSRFFVRYSNKRFLQVEPTKGEQMWKFLILFFVCLLARAEPTSSKNKVSFYENCMPSCMANQIANPENKHLLDVKFVLSSYCSCQCARMSMRISSEGMAQGDRAALSGQSIATIAEIKRIFEVSSRVCLTALTSD